MMKKVIAIIVAAVSLSAAAYTPVQGKLMTTWGENIDSENVWNVYPRPTMERADWQNLNGLWNYAIVPANNKQPKDFQGEILVPFCAESTLSGVGKEVGADNALWYRRTFTVPKAWKGKDVLLNFGAVDWQADVWVNGAKIGSHTGGYTPFSFNITPALNAKGDNEIVVRVWDPTDRGTQPRGKQVSHPETIWYTPVTGIWQTVWLEPVASAHIENIKILSDIDRNELKVKVDATPNTLANIVVKDNGKTIAEGKTIAGGEAIIEMPANVELWSTTNPKLYDVEVTLTENGKVVDKVDSYAAMRKISMGMGQGGVVRMMLNNKEIFHYGPLDQGWWPDGLYTAPSYEAMIYDIDKTADWGFNMIRKHIKVEPATWYAYCDKKGILVWQDMPSGDVITEWQMRNYYDGDEWQRSPASEANYRKEWREIMDALYNHPSIAVWVPFNEGWGQFKTKEIAAWTKAYDPSRLVNSASGGNFFPCGDILDAHNYPAAPDMHVFDAKRANVLGEYGGIGMPVDGHMWKPDHNWGYIQYKTLQEVTDAYVNYAEKLNNKADNWFTGAVYTQTTDVEIEANGLMTYDRKVVKIDEDRVREVNQRVINNHSAK